jgi:hypothetical protein
MMAAPQPIWMGSRVCNQSMAASWSSKKRVRMADWVEEGPCWRFQERKTVEREVAR